MLSHNTVIIIALMLAVFMSMKPELFIPNPKHRTTRVKQIIKTIGLSVGLVLIVWILLPYIAAKV